MRLRRSESEIAELDMTPLINAVFLLLMFLMIVISFQNTKAEERSKLPRDQLARPPLVQHEHEVVLNFGYQRDADGKRIRPSLEVFHNERFVEVLNVLEHLEMERRVMERVHGGDALRHTTVVIRADAEIPAGLVQELVRQCQAAGFSKFLLRPREEVAP